ncbi:MAG: glycosyltransferase [Candidatus Omnitrophica bacterium]|nr:glycosyltransferase [Candidatus Omnitrophota bacterium]
MKSDSFKILILNGDLPVFPGWGGIEFLHTTALARMAKKLGLVSLVHTREQSGKKQLLADAGVSLYLWENPHLDQTSQVNGSRPTVFRRTAKALYNIARAWPPRPHDTLIQDFQFCTLAGPILQALNEVTWDALVVVQSNCAYWMDQLPSFPVRVLVMHDVRALVHKRRAQVANSFIERVASLLQAQLYRRFEHAYSRKYDLIITVSSTDEAWVRKYYQPQRVVTIPIPIDTTYFTPMPDEPVAKSRILFTGMMNHPPNVDAACFFARDVFPQIQASIPEAQFWIVGRDPTSEVKDLATLPGVVVTGLVPDIRPYKARTQVEVVPLRFGAGMRQKILEAWSMEKCVVSTEIGAEGLDYQDGVNILIANDAKTMADNVIKALKNPTLSERIGRHGHDLVVNQHRPSELSRKYHEAIVSVVKEKAGHIHTLIDLRWMVPGVAGGIENMSRSFINELFEQDSFNHYSLLVPSLTKYDFDLRRNPNINVIVADGPGYYGKFLWWRGKQLIHKGLKLNYWRSPEVEMLRRGRDLNADCVLSLSGYIYPDMLSMRNVVVVPDLQHEYHPEFFSADVLEERTRIFSHSITQADHLIAISEYTRQTIIERFKIDPDRIKTIHLAADPIFYKENRTSGNKELILKKYNLPDKGYLFFPSNTWPHKNHKGAIEALNILNREYGHDLLLVCTGSGKEAEKDLQQLVRKLGLEERVRFLGYCPSKDMFALYEGAALLIYPSFFEGFGIPLLEAMWCDCPIVCSNLTCLPEIAGDAALLVDPHSSDDLAASVDRVLTDEDLRSELIERGRARALQFSWSRFTSEIIRLLYQIRSMN